MDRRSTSPVPPTGAVTPRSAAPSHAPVIDGPPADIDWPADPVAGTAASGSTAAAPDAPTPGASPAPSAAASPSPTPTPTPTPSPSPSANPGTGAPDAKGQADLGISAMVTGTPAKDLITVTLTVRNLGPDVAPGTMVSLVAPSNSTITGTARGCTAVTVGHEYRCDLGDAPLGTGTALFTFRLGGPVAAATDGTAAVTSDLADPDLTDNIATVSLRPPAAPGTLPVTGGRTEGLAGTGLAALGAGIALSVLGRWRRRRRTLDAA